MTLAPQEEEVHTRDIFELYVADDPKELEQWVKLGAHKASDRLCRFHAKFVHLLLVLN